MNISLNKITTKALATFAETLIRNAQKQGYDVLSNHELLTKLQEEYAIYDQVYTKLAFSGKGQSVAEADKARDKAFSGIKQFLKGYQKIETMPYYQDAVALYEILKTFGLNLDTLNYIEESAQMKKLIEELEKDDNLAKLQNLSLEDTFNQMKNAQATFQRIYDEQVQANSDLRKTPSASAIRKRVEEAIRNYLMLITAMRNVEGWKVIYAETNEVVKSIKLLSVDRSPSETK